MSANTKDRNTPESVYYYVQGIFCIICRAIEGRRYR